MNQKGSLYIRSEFGIFNLQWFEPTQYLPVDPKDPNFSAAVTALWKWMLEQEEIPFWCYECWFQFMWCCAQAMPYPDFYKAQHQIK